MPQKCLLEPEQNQFLAAFSPEVQRRLFPDLELVTLPLRALLYDTNTPMQHVYFPIESIISIQHVMSSGTSTSIAVVGNEGLLGINLFLSDVDAHSRSIVHSPGHAFRLPKLQMEKELKRHGELLVQMLRYTQALFSQVAQTAVCNRYHSVDQQFCRWLLLSIDRLSGRNLNMTQEFIAKMLGVRREGVSAAASKLQQLGVIHYSRGQLRVLDRQKLEGLSCECYAKVRQETDLLLDYVPQRR